MRVSFTAALLVLACAVLASCGEDDRELRAALASAQPEWSDGSWRPFAASSPFNQPVGKNPKLHPRSRKIVRRLHSFGPAQDVLLGTAGHRWDYNHPIYFNEPGDRRVRISCTANWGRCPVEGLRVGLPADAMPAAGGDRHLTIVDSRTGWSYDLWDVHRVDRKRGVLVASWGGRARMAGSGLGSGATAAEFASAAGIIRAAELEAGRIDHALFLVAECSSGRSVFPSGKSGAGHPCDRRRDAPPLGARFVLRMSEAEIARVPGPPAKRAILRAMARYGMYFGDTGSGSWSVQLESGAPYKTRGKPDPFAVLGRKQGMPSDNGIYSLKLGAGVDWSRLAVVAPCETRGRC